MVFFYIVSCYYCVAGLKIKFFKPKNSVIIMKSHLTHPRNSLKLFISVEYFEIFCLKILIDNTEFNIIIINYNQSVFKLLKNRMYNGINV